MVKNKEYHYFYKITNLINEHYYYGIHSTNNLNDGYMGSGVRLNKAYKKYGIENFTKTVSRKPTALVVGWIETPLFDIIL